MARVDAVRFCLRPCAFTARSRHRRWFTLYALRQPAGCSVHAYLRVRSRVSSRARDSLCALVCFHSRLVAPVFCLSAFTRARASMPLGVHAPCCTCTPLRALVRLKPHLSLARVDAIRLCPRPSALTARSRHTRWFTLHAICQPAGCSVHAYLRVRPRVSWRAHDSLCALVCFHSRLVAPVVCLSAFTLSLIHI